MVEVDPKTVAPNTVLLIRHRASEAMVDVAVVENVVSETPKSPETVEELMSSTIKVIDTATDRTNLIRAISRYQRQ